LLNTGIPRAKTIFLTVAFLIGAQTLSLCRAELSTNSFAAGTGEALSGWQLTLQFEKSSYEPGEPVIAIVTLKNVSDEDQTWTGALLDSSDITFIASRGREHPRVEPWTGVFSANAAGSQFQHTMASKESRVYRIQLDQRMDLTQPGSYVVTATRIVPEAAYRFEFNPDGKLEVVPLDRPHTHRNEKLRSANVVIEMAKAKAGAALDSPSSSKESSPSNSPPKQIPTTSAGIRARQPDSTSEDSAEHSSSEANLMDSRATNPSTTSNAQQSGFPSGKAFAGGMIAALLAFIGAVLWRGALRKPAG
jgi:hypothetical protein